MIQYSNPNPHANIAIVCKYQFFFHVFESVYKNLDQVEFVLDFSGTVGEQTYPVEYKETVRKFFQDKGVFWRDPELTELSISEFFSKYAVLVSPFYGGLMKHPCNRNKKKVHVQYGISKESWAYGLSNVYFDLHLCAGPHAAERLKMFGATVIATGEPKHDQYFSLKSREEIIAELQLKFDPQKETILYLPTWGLLSSLFEVIPALVQLSGEYNVVVKTHHMTALYEAKAQSLTKDSRLNIIYEATHIMDAIKLSDIVVSDNSSAIFDAVVTKKKLVLVDNLENSKEKFFAETLFHTSTATGNPTGSKSYPESIEQLVKERDREIAPVIRYDSFTPNIVTATALRTALERAGDERYVLRRERLSKILFSYFDGLSGERVADAIKKLRESPSQRNKDFERLVDEFEQRTRTEQENLLRKTQQELSRYNNIKKLPYKKRLLAIVDEFFQNKRVTHK